MATCYQLVLLTLSLTPVIVSAGGSGGVIFVEDGTAGAPAAFGHMVFGLRKDELHHRFSEYGEKVVQSFLDMQNVTDRRHICHGKQGRCSPVDLLNAVHLNTTSQAALQAAELAGIVRAIERVELNMERMLFGKCEPEARHKRQFVEGVALGLGIVSFGMTLKNAYDINKLRAKMDSVESRLNGLIHLDEEIMRVERLDHQMIVRLVQDEIRNRQRMDELGRMSVYVAHKDLLDGILIEATQASSAFGLLRQGIVSDVVLNTTRLDRSYDQFSKNSAKKLLRPMTKSAEEAVGARSTYWTEGCEVLRVAVPVPMVALDSTLLKAYRLEDRPATPPGEDGLQIVFHSEHTHILVAADRSYYYALSTEDWLRCKPIGESVVCPEVRLRRDDFSTTCVGALFKALPTRNSICDFKVRRAPVLEVKEGGVGSLLITSAGEGKSQWCVRCGDGACVYNYTTKGTTELKIGEGCAAFGPDLAYQVLAHTEDSWQIEFVEQHGLDELPASLRAADFASWGEVRGLLDEHDLDEYVEASRLAELRSKQILKKLQADSHLKPTVGGWIGVAAAVGILLVGAVVVVLWRKHSLRSGSDKRCEFEMGERQQELLATLQARFAEQIAALDARRATDMAEMLDQIRREIIVAVNVRPGASGTGRGAGRGGRRTPSVISVDAPDTCG